MRYTIFLAIFLLASCSDSKLTSTKQGQKTASSSENSTPGSSDNNQTGGNTSPNAQAASENVNGEEGEDINDLQASIPQEVAGAYLTCVEGDREEESRNVFCSLYSEEDAKGERLNLTGYNVEFSVYNKKEDSENLAAYDIRKDVLYRVQIEKRLKRRDYTLKATYTFGDKTLEKTTEVQKDSEYDLFFELDFDFDDWDDFDGWSGMSNQG